jgi:hypothetical protein
VLSYSTLQTAAFSSSTVSPGTPSGLTSLQKASLGLAAMFGGGYAIGYFFGPFPSLEELAGVKAVSGAPEYKGEVRTAGPELVAVGCSPC